MSCTVPFRPTGSKPVYCSSCFNSANVGGSSAPAPRMNNDHYKDQFKIINQKLDAIMRILSPSSVAPSLEQEVEQMINAVEPVVKEKKFGKKKVDAGDSLDIEL
jgi:hypothetical protein